MSRQSRFTPIVKPVDGLCNLSCSYCYTSGLKECGAGSRMRVEVLKSTIDFFCRDQDYIEFTWHGGEPLLAIGLANKKRVLYLLQRGSMIDPSVDALTKNQEVKKYIKIAFYTPENLIRKVKAFLQYLDQSIGKELFSIKYTLRLSPRLDRYIVWKSSQTKKSKADFLRDWMKENMEKDSEYQNRLQ